MNILSNYIKKFLTDYLKEQRGLSKNTILSYRDTFRLLLEFITSNNGSQELQKFSIFDLDVKFITSFLAYIEKQRNNKTQTRNNRLACIHSFFKYLSLIDDTFSSYAKKILSIPIKKTSTKAIDYLEKEEINLIFKQIDTSKGDGFRDLCILTFLYNTGSRAQEVADIKLSCLRTGGYVSIIGKGNKERNIPLWESTSKLLNTYIKKYRRKPKEGYQEYLFIGQRGEKFNRFGIRMIVKKYIQKAQDKNPSLKQKKLSVHNIRHTTATHLHQSGVDITLIKSWLGHININTTAKYIEINLDRKKQILDKFRPISYVKSFLEQENNPEQQKEDLDNWLKSL